MTKRNLDRRDFLRLAGLASIPVLTPRIFVWGLDPAMALDGQRVSDAIQQRVLVLVELKGGNDGLNTVVPYADDTYYRLRPRIGIPRTKVLALYDQVGLNPALKPLMNAWEKHELAVVQGVGYPNPNRSHFRSIEIWETGSDSDEFLMDGWISRLFANRPRPEGLAADGCVIGRGGLGPLIGAGLRNVVMDDPHTFYRRAKVVKEITGTTGNAALDHLLQVRRDLRKAAGMIEKQHRRYPALDQKFRGIGGRNGLGQQLKLAAELLMSKVPVSIIKVAQGGYDTHSRQKGRHANLLTVLGKGLGAFRDSLRDAGLWDRVLVMTYSEFGRRVQENASVGTDHGTAAPHFLMGGKVKGGLYGKQPSLTQLQRGDLRHHVDFRELYATVASDWWKLPQDVVRGLNHKPVKCLKIAPQI